MYHYDQHEVIEVRVLCSLISSSATLLPIGAIIFVSPNNAPSYDAGILEVMGYDLALGNWRQNVLHCSHHGHEES